MRRTYQQWPRSRIRITRQCRSNGKIRPSLCETSSVGRLLVVKISFSTQGPRSELKDSNISRVPGSPISAHLKARSDKRCSPTLLLQHSSKCRVDLKSLINRRLSLRCDQARWLACHRRPMTCSKRGFKSVLMSRTELQLPSVGVPDRRFKAIRIIQAGFLISSRASHMIPSKFPVMQAL